MSAYDTKRTSRQAQSMSAFGGIAGNQPDLAKSPLIPHATCPIQDFGGEAFTPLLCCFDVQLILLLSALLEVGAHDREFAPAQDTK
jgi:hypothetical protein